MVYGFVKQSQGYIALSNRTTGGACITLLLPADPNRYSPEAPKQTEGPTAHDPGLVLVLDDDRDVRAVIRGQLLALGYQVIECSTPEEALELVSTLPEIDGLVSDIVMPGSLSGYDVAARFRQARPDAAIVLVSGFTPANGQAESPYPLLRKPFTQQALGQLLASPQARKASNHQQQEK